MIAQIDDVLRCRGRFGPQGSALPQRTTLAALVAAALGYGAVMGAYELRPLQMTYSGLKVPLLLSLSALVCLPNLLAVITVLGLREDLAAVLRALVLAQATACVCLAAFAPLTAVANLSLRYDLAVLYNGLVFLLAALAGQLTLGRHYGILIASNPRHRIARNVWLGLYLFVAIQLAWVLRPFVGDPGQPTRFFREGAWGNAYVEVAQMVWRALAR